MQLIIIVILGAVLGFTYGSFTDGFIFSQDICLFAGITLIMPSLFKFKLRDIQLVWVHKMLLVKGFMLNYIILPFIALSLGFMTQDFGIVSGLLLISLLSGGGMVMHWIKKSNGDTSFGFLLLFINLLFISFSLLLLHVFAQYTAPYFDISYESEISISRFNEAVITLLIVIPFLASRVIIWVKPLVEVIEKYRRFISHFSILIILFYLFGLQNSQLLVDIYDFEPELIPISFVAVFFFYLFSYFVSKFIYNLDSPQERAAFWHSVTRYLTLALVISTFSITTFGVSMLLPIMFAYIVQIPWAIYIEKKVMKY